MGRLLLACVLVLCSAPGAALRAAEAMYAGRPLAYWAEQAKKGAKETPAEVIDALVGALKGQSLSDMVAAADALETIGPRAKAAAPALAGKLDHVQGWVRIASMNALKAIGADAVPAVLEVFEKGPPPARVRASIVLASMGPEARAAIPAVRKAIDGASGDQREQLLQVLARIEGREETSAPEKGPIAVDLGSAAGASPEMIGGDWPGFHGPLRDSICRETGLLRKWPEGGPPLLWKIEGLGRGHSTVSIADGRLFTMGDRVDKNGEGQFVIALDLANRRELWATRVGPPHEDGPRCTPTISGGNVYALGTDGDLVCIDVVSGSIRWRKHLVNDFGGRMMSGWKYSESPLVDGQSVICTPGAPNATLIALNKQSGDVLWRCAVSEFGPNGKSGAGYSSALVAEIDGVRQYVQMLGRGVVGVEAKTGRFLWGYNRIASRTANITHPIVRGNFVFATNAYQAGSALLKITRNGDSWKAEEVYFLDYRKFENHHGGVVLVNGHIYGGSGENRGEPVCIDMASGKIAWRGKPPERGSAAVLYADGHLIFRYDRGLVALVEATPDAFRLKGTFQPVASDGPAWAHPVIHQGKLYLRHNDVLGCYDVREKGE